MFYLNVNSCNQTHWFPPCKYAFGSYYTHLLSKLRISYNWGFAVKKSLKCERKQVKVVLFFTIFELDYYLFRTSLTSDGDQFSSDSARPCPSMDWLSLTFVGKFRFRPTVVEPSSANGTAYVSVSA